MGAKRICHLLVVVFKDCDYCIDFSSFRIDVLNYKAIEKLIHQENMIDCGHNAEVNITQTSIQVSIEVTLFVYYKMMLVDEKYSCLKRQGQEIETQTLSGWWYQEPNY